jgi:hypothetical protein
MLAVELLFGTRALDNDQFYERSFIKRKMAESVSVASARPPVRNDEGEE